MNDIISELRVSSVLNKDVKMFGKKYLFDDSEETCWSSDQGSPQWIDVVFKENYSLSSVNLQFQGGFAGKSCYFIINKTDGTEINLPFYPEDINTLQRFAVEPVNVKRIKIMFETSTDFFGRIVVYCLQFL